MSDCEGCEQRTAGALDGKKREGPMGLLNCPDCGRQVSTEAVACPGCGRPIKTGVGGWAETPSAAGPTEPRHQATPLVVQTVKSRGVFIVLGLFLGCLGIHNFYAGYNGKGAAQLVITLVLGWFIIGFVVTAVWALIDVCTVTVDASGNRMS
jgi:TM2 domain-containing membrane protein YozV